MYRFSPAKEYQKWNHQEIFYPLSKIKPFDILPVDIQVEITEYLSNKDILRIMLTSKTNYEHLNTHISPLQGYIEAQKYLHKHFVSRSSYLLQKLNNGRHNIRTFCSVIQNQSTEIKRCGAANPWFTYYFLIHIIKYYLLYNPNLSYLNSLLRYSSAADVVSVLKQHFFDDQGVFEIPNINGYSLEIHTEEYFPCILRIQKDNRLSACVLYEALHKHPKTTKCNFNLKDIKKIYFALGYIDTSSYNTCLRSQVFVRVDLQEILEYGNIALDTVRQLTIWVGVNKILLLGDNLEKGEAKNLKRLFINARSDFFPSTNTINGENNNQLSQLIFNKHRCKNNKLKGQGTPIPFSDSNFKKIVYKNIPQLS